MSSCGAMHRAALSAAQGTLALSMKPGQKVPRGEPPVANAAAEALFLSASSLHARKIHESLVCHSEG